MALREADVLDVAEAFRGARYSLTDPRFPHKLRGVSGLRAPPPLQTNCCALVESLVIGAADCEWTQAQHRLMMIDGPPVGSFSPVDTLVRAGLAVPGTSPDAVPPPWSVVQGWRADGPDADLLPDGGHTFLVVRSNGPLVLILEANLSFGLDGVGFRGGPRFEGDLDLGAYMRGDGWAARSNVWSWARVRRLYPELRWCALQMAA